MSFDGRTALEGYIGVTGVPRSTMTVLYTESSISRCLDDFVVRYPCWRDSCSRQGLEVFSRLCRIHKDFGWESERFSRECLRCGPDGRIDGPKDIPNPFAWTENGSDTSIDIFIMYVSFEKTGSLAIQDVLP